MDKLNDSPEADDKGGKPTAVKEEPSTDTIKNYAENTMNELLGLFGYDDKVNSADTENLNLDNYAESKENGSDVSCDEKSCDKGVKLGRKATVRLSTRSLADHTNLLAQQHMNLVTALKRREQAELAERSSDGTSERDGSLQCAWCKKPGNKQFSLETSTGLKVFCSEVCFTQCRRASFKKSKICDWCKHVRHTVNYVEFQDGEAQLQFCSEKCLNQYKMSIFCKETQEHLRALTDKGEDVTSDKHGERSILITPELWMNGENVRRAAEARETALDRMSMSKRENKEGYHRSHNSNSERSRLKVHDSKLTGVDNARHSLIERIKTEANMKHKRTVVNRESDRSTSPGRTEPVSQSPQPQGQSPTPFLHPGLSGMVPWIQPAHLLGSMAPGLPPMAGYQPMIFPGFFPAFPSGVVPEVNASMSQEKESGERERRTLKKESTAHSSRLLSPNSGRSSSASDMNSHTNDFSSASRSPGLNERRTSSLFPVDFPQMFPNPAFPGPQLQANLNAMPGSRIPPLQLPGMPPATMMLPFPVVLPMPVPVPIPIPLTMNTLAKHFNKTVENNASSKSEHLTDSEKHKDSQLSPSQLTQHSPQSIASTGSEMSSYDRHDGRSRSRGSCPDLTRSFGGHGGRLSVSEPMTYKRSRTPDEAMSLDLSKHSKIAKYDFSGMESNSNDEVMDLSATRDIGLRSDESCSENGALNGHIDAEGSSPGEKTDSYPEDGAPVPKIHIITHRDEAPLNQPLPLPPVDNSYSSRRGLILDAPTVPKKSRSPSPERRVYVRNVPRDLIEAARRRCLRTRIRTK